MPPRSFGNETAGNKDFSIMCLVYAHFEKKSSKLIFPLIHVSVLICFPHDMRCLLHHNSILLNENVKSV